MSRARASISLGDGALEQVPVPTQEQLENLRSFIDEYAGELRDVEEALDESVTEVWDSEADFFGVRFAPKEQAHIRELLKTDNKIVAKLILVFSVLCQEVNDLKSLAEKKYFSPLSVYGVKLDDEPMSEGDDITQISRMIPLLEEICTFVKRANALCKNMVTQMASLYNEKSNLYQQTVKGVHLQIVFRKISEIVGVLISLDVIIGANDDLLLHWANFKKMISNCKLEPSMFNIEGTTIDVLEKSANSIEAEILQGSIFRNCIAQDFGWIDERSVQEARSNRTFMEELGVYVKNQITYLGTHIGEANESDHQNQFLSFTGLYVLYSYMMRGRDIDKALHKQVLKVSRRAPIVHIYGRAVWVPEDFLRGMLPAFPSPTDTTFLENFSRALDDSFVQDLQPIYLEVCAWMVRMESSFSTKITLSEMLTQRTYLLIRGLLLAHQVSAKAKLEVMLHLHLQTPFKESSVRGLGQCVELIKAIKATYFRKTRTVADHINHISRHLCLLLEKALKPIKTDLETQLGSGKKGSWRQDDIKLDTLSEITLMISLLKGPLSLSRRLLINLTWDMMHKKAMKEIDVDEVKTLLRKMDLIGNMQETVEETCNCNWLLFSRDLFGAFMKDVYSKPEEANRLHYLMAAMRDPVATLTNAIQNSSNLPSIESYKKFIEKQLEINVISPLCRDIENDLRVHIHSAAIEQLQMPDAGNPFKIGVKDLSAFLKMKPLRFFGADIDIKARVTHYLDTTFYNLTTVALHDWKTYGEMRNLVQEKYGVMLTETHLPTGTLEQGLDVLEIMRNIHVFVSRFDYNLNTQIFVERPTENKYLNTIGIRQIANSIRTHGTGIMNTTVNYTYQFLARKFVIFSQFLFDDHIKSRLIKDLRFYKQNKDALDNKYPFERAEKFNKDIRKLGSAGADNATYLDKFRELVTEIGNALGFVRMIRAGGLNYCANAVKFVPDLQNVLEFEEAVTKEGLSGETISAAANLDSVVSDLNRKFAEGTDFFKLLSQVFAAELQSEQNAHLKNFHMIIPALCVNFVEFIMKAKDRLVKNFKRGQPGTFTDDGFAIGVAYILKVLNQNKEFDSLHWFVMVKIQMAQEKDKLDKQKLEKKKVNDDELASMQLAMSRLQTRMMEFDQLYYSLSGARIFFKD